MSTITGDPQYTITGIILKHVYIVSQAICIISIYVYMCLSNCTVLFLTEYDRLRSSFVLPIVLYKYITANKNVSIHSPK